MSIPLEDLGAELETLYHRYNRRSFLSPDPLEMVSVYEQVQDREIAALVAACLSYGRVRHILASLERVFAIMEGRPRQFAEGSSRAEIRRAFSGFRHRVTAGASLASLLVGVKSAIEQWGNLERCFRTDPGNDETLMPAASRFVDRLRAGAESRLAHVLASPADGSACKRLNLFLRWMVRRDSVDPGGWDGVPAAKLVVPLDTHMHRIALRLGLTRRRQADLRTALQVTSAFRQLSPQDPVRYDFVLTRLGIREDTDLEGFLTRCGSRGGRDV